MIGAFSKSRTSSSSRAVRSTFDHKSRGTRLSISRLAAIADASNSASVKCGVSFTNSRLQRLIPGCQPFGAQLIQFLRREVSALHLRLLDQGRDFLCLNLEVDCRRKQLCEQPK